MLFELTRLHVSEQERLALDAIRYSELKSQRQSLQSSPAMEPAWSLCNSVASINPPAADKKGNAASDFSPSGVTTSAAEQPNRTGVISPALQKAQSSTPGMCRCN
jgi:hypothetical protein